jgi:hypothetical protein
MVPRAVAASAAVGDGDGDGDDGGGAQRMLHVQRTLAAQDVRVGMAVNVDSGGVPAWSEVTSVGAARRRGLYNPYTASHTLLVNNVTSLVDSDWFLEGSGLPASAVVAAYRALLSPVRAYFRVFPGHVRRFCDHVQQQDQGSSLGDVSLASLARKIYDTSEAPAWPRSWFLS